MWSLSSSVCNQQRNLGVIARMIATPMNREHTGRRQTNRQASELLVGQFSPLLCSGQSVLLTVITFINKVNYHLSFLAFYLIKQVFDRWTDMTLLPSWVSWVKKKNKMHWMNILQKRFWRNTWVVLYLCVLLFKMQYPQSSTEPGQPPLESPPKVPKCPRALDGGVRTAFHQVECTSSSRLTVVPVFICRNLELFETFGIMLQQI